MGRKHTKSVAERKAEKLAEIAQLDLEIAFEMHSDSPCISLLRDQLEKTVLNARTASTAQNEKSAQSIQARVKRNILKGRQYIAQEVYFALLSKVSEGMEEILGKLIQEFSDKRTELMEAGEVSEEEDENLRMEAEDAFNLAVSENPELGELAEAAENTEKAVQEYKAFQASFAAPMQNEPEIEE